MTSTPPVAAGARIRFTVTGTVRSCYQQGQVTLADGTSLSYRPDQHRTVVLTEGWRPGDLIETEHGRLRRTERGGYAHWTRESDGQMFHDDQVDPVRARVISWWGGRRHPADPGPTETEPLRKIADFLARHYDGQPLAELRDEHAAPHLEAAAHLLPLMPVEPPFATPREQDRSHRWEVTAELVAQARKTGTTELPTETMAELLGLDEDEAQGPSTDALGRAR
ncbi:hypothetical protein ACIQTN_29620 [Streptomyces werraensis]|uniref:hypothetical protein n=1 Tax=Streptomyces werraensis TaxID=68284 RepID=UPI0037FA7299